MTIRLLNFFAELHRRIVSSIGFWPTVIPFLFGVAAVLVLAINTDPWTTALLEHVPKAVIKDGDTARVILSTIIGGLVSLTVFTFTMVMAQLNRAATNYSPRLLPGLISSRHHQFVLGFFLGTITFCLIVLITIEPSNDSYDLPGLAILLASLLSIACLGIFVYFIHSISQAIQVTNILQRVADDTGARLDKLGNIDERQKYQDAPDMDFPESIPCKLTGYFQGYNAEALLDLAQKNDVTVRVIPIQGEFVLQNTGLLELTSSVSDTTREELLSCIRFSGNTLTRDNYVLGFKQIAEIAVRAMSPSTNDPGTALTAIDHLTSLFAKRMRIDDREILCNHEGTPRAVITVLSFSDLLYTLNAALRLYCKHDVVIVLKLLQMFDYLSQQPCEDERHREALRREIDNLVTDASHAIKNETDLKMVRRKAAAIGDNAQEAGGDI